MHGGLILAVVLADAFSTPRADRTPAVTDVSLVSAAEFAAMFGQPAPQMPTATPEPAPEPGSEPIPAAPAPDPEPAPPPPPPPEPEAAAPAEPAPPQDGTEDQRQAAVVAPEPSPPDASLRPVQRPAERVAPEPVPEPEPEVEIGRVDQPAVTPEEEASEPAPEALPEQEPTAREAAATETVTEATELSETEAPRRTATAPEVSLRPERRPARPPAPQTEPQAEPPTTTQTARPAPDPDETPPPPAQSEPRADAIADALAEALSGQDTSPAPGAGGTTTGGLTQADIDMLRLSVEDCWNVGALSTEAMNVVVTIGFEMTPDARPVPGTIQLVEASGGGPVAQSGAFEAGRRAIIECGTNGYGLPSDLFEAWRQVEITFNPARMSFR